MNRIEEILIRARYTLADPQGQKWSDKELLSFLDEAQKDLCKRAKLLRSEVQFNVLAGRADYTLPEDFLLLDSVYLNDKALQLKGYAEMDKLEMNWMAREGVPNTVIFDKQMRGRIKLYPIPDTSPNWAVNNIPVRITTENPRIRQNFGVVSDVPFPSTVTSDFGVTTGIGAIWQIQEDVDMPRVVTVEYNFKQDYGVATNAKLTIGMEKDINPWGVLTSFDGVDSPEPWGILTGIEGWPEAEIRFTDTWGVTADSLKVEPWGYYKHFKDVGNVANVLEAKQVMDFGVINAVSPLSGVNVEFVGDFGMPTGLYVVTDTLRVLYLRKPKDVVSLESELEVDDSLDTALKYYVTGRALASSIDTQNRAFGAEEMNRYLELVTLAEKDDSKDFTRSSKVWYSNYNGGI